MSELFTAQICNKCNQPVVPDYKVCERHLAMQRQYSQNFRDKRRSNGLCVYCGFQKIEDRPCQECFRRYRLRVDRLLAAGLRTRCCLVPSIVGQTYCISCSDGRAQYKHDKRIINGVSGLCIDCSRPTVMFKRCHQCRTNNSLKRFEYKTDVISHYGIKCACCGHSDMIHLSIDYINGGGKKHKADLGINGSKIYRWLMLNNYPDGFQTLCYNCNCAKSIYSCCPHIENRILSRSGLVRLKLKNKIFDKYGGKCVICSLSDINFLSLDHINNNGAEHKRSILINGGGSVFYYWLQCNNFPKIVQVMCYNHNAEKLIRNATLCI